MVGVSLLCPLRGVGKRKSKREFSVQLSVVNGARRQLTFQTISANVAANNTQCAVPENIHTPPTEGRWKFRRGGGDQRLKFPRVVGGSSLSFFQRVANSS